MNPLGRGLWADSEACWGVQVMGCRLAEVEEWSECWLSWMGEAGCRAGSAVAWGGRWCKRMCEGQGGRVGER